MRISAPGTGTERQGAQNASAVTTASAAAAIQGSRKPGAAFGAAGASDSIASARLY